MTAWVTTADVQTWLGPQVDDVTAAGIAVAASNAVRTFIERDIELQTGLVEYYNSNNTDYILLSFWPVRQIVSVAIQGMPSTIPALAPPAQMSGYQLDKLVPRKLKFVGYGRIARASANITVVYDAGYDLTANPGTPTGIPADMYLALKLTANAIYNSQAADTNLASENTAGVFSGSYYASGAGAVPPGARSLLNNYRRGAP